MDVPIILHIDPQQQEATLQLTIVVKIRSEGQAPKQAPERELLKVGEACALAGVGRSTAYEYMRSGAWEAVRIGKKGIRFRRSSLMVWINNLPTTKIE